MSFGRRWVVLVTLVAFAGVAACEGPPEPVRLTWQEISLPLPAIGERLAIRAATVCSGRWFLTGAIVGADGATRPAAWASDDGHTYTAVPIAPNTFYGRQNTLYSAACRYRWLAAIGAKSGGAHGFPRTSNWYLDATGVLQQNEVPYTLYGGPDGVNLSRIVGGPAAWLETGNQVGGATVWISRDAETFRKIAGAPGLASADDVSTWATDAASVPSGWVIVGAVTQSGHDREPAAWQSSDGLSWRRLEVPGTRGYDEIQRVAVVGGELVGIGLSGGVFSSWRGDGPAWRATGQLGPSGPPGQGAAVALAAVGTRLYAVTSDGKRFELSESTDVGETWRPVATPAASPAGPDRSATVVGDGRQLLMIVDDGRGSRGWTADLAPGADQGT